MNLIDIYTEVFANWASGGSLVSRDKISLLGIRPLYDRYLTNGYITKVWCINALPVYYNKNISQAIRSEMFKLMPNVRTLVHTVNRPVAINIMSDVYKRQLSRTAEGYNQYKEVFESMSDDQQLMGSVQIDNNGRKMYINSSILNNIKQAYDSYRYVYQQVAGGNSFYNTFYFIQASAKTKREIRLYTKHLRTLLEGEGIIYTEVKGNVAQYLNNYCPTTYQQEPTKKFIPMLFSQENLVATTGYKTKGLIGGRGVLVGNEVMTGLPFQLNFTGSGSAQVAMLLARSGEGKTYIAFLLALGLAGIDIHWSATDIKGNEWYERLHSLMSGVIKISLDDSSGGYVNFMRLDDLDCTEDDCVEAYDSAIRDTVTTLSLMTELAPSEGNKADLNSILETAAIKVMSSHEVVKTNPATFSRTRCISYQDVIDVVTELAQSKSYTDEQRHVCNLIRVRCSNYLSAEGRFSSAFKREITVKDVLASPGVVYALNKNASSQLDSLDSIRVHMAQGLDSRKILYRKREHKFTAAFYEELQRCNQLDTLIEAMSHRVTGSRSDNAIIFLLLNSIATFDSPALAAIKSNITTMIVGKVNTDDIDVLVRNYGCKSIESYIRKIHSDEGERFRNAFAIRYDLGYEVDKGIVKAKLPARVSEAFATRDIIDA